MDYSAFFCECTGNSPFPYQARLGEGDWPDLLDIPTGLGKTAAVVVAWLWRRLNGDARAPRRLVYCLPMRVLVNQTHREAMGWIASVAARFEATGQACPTVHLLRGGEIDVTWEQSPEAASIIIGTQDQLLSRALNRGYASSPFKWPVHFGLLNNDVLWVYDETQLMGVGVETGAQLHGLREKLGTLGTSHSIWMSATLGREQLETVDHPRPAAGWSTHQLAAVDRQHPVVAQRTTSHKALAPLGLTVAKDADTAHDKGLAARVLELHKSGTLTLVIVNRVARAQGLYAALLKQGRAEADTALIHSRFRPADRAEAERILEGEGDRILVATQAVEAGVDISSTTLITELAPWPSLVQRFGRCNRYGEVGEAQVYWIDIDPTAQRGAPALPYEPEQLAAARLILNGLVECGPDALGHVEFVPPRVVRPVLRRRDVMELFDTSADLSGNHIDVSRFVRDGEDNDVSVYWRDFEGSPNDQTQSGPHPGELCRVSLAAARKLIDTLKKKDKGVTKQGATRFVAWLWDPIQEDFEPLRHDVLRPGLVLLLHCTMGCYTPTLGWTGTVGKSAVPETPGDQGQVLQEISGDPDSRRGIWVELSAHLGHVEHSMGALSEALDLEPQTREALCRAAAWHDVGKAHPVFQGMLTDPGKTDPQFAPPSPDRLWAKSNHRQGRASRRFFRHELASTLAFLSHVQPTNGNDLTGGDALSAYLMASHHGKVRMAIRSLPDETPAPQGRRFARGVWDGDVLPSVALGTGDVMAETALDLGCMELGQGSWLELTTGLRDDPDLGPYRLGYLEALLRASDWRASAEEETP